jgi:hypothetical protein
MRINRIPNTISGWGSFRWCDNLGELDVEVGEKERVGAAGLPPAAMWSINYGFLFESREKPRAEATRFRLRTARAEA